MSTPVRTPTNVSGVLSESRRIIKAHYLHFLVLSFLFLFPISVSVFIYPILIPTLSQSTKTLLFSLLYALFVSFFSLCGIGTIVYSAYLGFYGKPVNLVSSIKSLLRSFLPLVATTIASQIIIYLVLLAVLVTQGTDYNWYYSFGIVIAVLISITVCIQVIWALASVIVVVESKWGFAPLWRSANLVKGMRHLSFSLLVYYAAITYLWMFSCSTWGLKWDSIGWILCILIKIVVGSILFTEFMLESAVSYTVLYVYCKASHGGLEFETAEDYVRLPFEDEKVPNPPVVSEVGGV